MARGEHERRRTTRRVADQVETFETRLVRDSRDAGDLRCERVVGRRRLRHVDLKLFGSSVDLPPQLREECPVRGFGRHDATGEEDHLPTTIAHVDTPRFRPGASHSTGRGIMRLTVETAGLVTRR